MSKRDLQMRGLADEADQQGQLTDPLKTDPSWGFVLSVIFVQILRTIKSDPLYAFLLDNARQKLID